MSTWNCFNDLQFFDKKSANHKGIGVNSENQQLADELNKPAIRKIGKLQIYSSFKDNFWGADSANLELVRKYNKIIRFSTICH